MLLSCDFVQSRIDLRVFINLFDNMFVVDDLKFESNAPSLLDYVKKKLRSTFDIKLFGALKTFFIGWEINESEDGFKVTQSKYTQKFWPSTVNGDQRGCQTNATR